MHGIVRPKDAPDARSRADWSDRLRQAARTYRYFLWLVVMPTLAVAFYLYAIASDQYETRADFVIRRADSAALTNNVGQFLGMNLGTSATTSEAYLVSDYLLSHDAVARLRKEDRLVERFRFPGTDWVSRLWYADPDPEQLLKYFRGQVGIFQDTETGISHLRVHAFDPDSAHAIASKLLALGEERINELNERTYRDQVAHARNELAKANDGLAAVESQMTAFRKRSEDIDPAGSGHAQIGLVANLTANLTVARARLRAMDGAISRDSPQYRAATAQVNALEAQVAGQSNRIAGSGASIASTLGDYESLVIRREAAARRYGAAAAEFEHAKAEAERKQVYLVRVVDVNRAVQSLYPERAKIVFVLFLALTFAYGIGWMIVMGIREHDL